MMTIVLVLLIAALVCFLVAAVIGHAEGAGSRFGRTNFLALGLAFWVTTAIMGVFPG